MVQRYSHSLQKVEVASSSFSRRGVEKASLLYIKGLPTPRVESHFELKKVKNRFGCNLFSVLCVIIVDAFTAGTQRKSWHTIWQGVYDVKLVFISSSGLGFGRGCANGPFQFLKHLGFDATALSERILGNKEVRHGLIRNEWLVTWA
jgi:hypothetical protein